MLSCASAWLLEIGDEHWQYHDPEHTQCYEVPCDALAMIAPAFLFFPGEAAEFEGLLLVSDGLIYGAVASAF